MDDNRDAAASLAMVLKQTGHDVQTVLDGAAALQAAESFRPHLTLLDIGLPKMSGYEVCRRMREQLRGKHMVLVALTGWGQDEDRRRSLEAGFDVHIGQTGGFRPTRNIDRRATAGNAMNHSPGQRPSRRCGTRCE